MKNCGGCRGLGSHSKYCARHPDFHPWKILAAQAESIGDSIGSNDTELANRAYQLSGLILQRMGDHPFRRSQP